MKCFSSFEWVYLCSRHNLITVLFCLQEISTSILPSYVQDVQTHIEHKSPLDCRLPPRWHVQGETFCHPNGSKHEPRQLVQLNQGDKTSVKVLCGNPVPWRELYSKIDYSSISHCWHQALFRCDDTPCFELHQVTANQKPREAKIWTSFNASTWFTKRLSSGRELSAWLSARARARMLWKLYHRQSTLKDI